MKKNNKANKLIILAIIVLIFTISLVIFVLNYTKDSSSLSILEKNWINNNNKVIDVSVYNDVPLYGQDGEGIIFAYLDEFTDKYDVEFNKVSYLVDSNVTLKNVAFRILDYNTNLTDDDILMYKDYYVIVGLTTDTVSDIKDLSGSNIGVFDKEISDIRYFLNDGDNIKFTSCKNFSEMLNFLKSKDIDYMAIPGNLYLDDILKNNLSVVYHMSEVYKKYVITVKGDNTFRSIISKFNTSYYSEHDSDNMKSYFLNTFFKFKDVSEVEKKDYNSQSYVFGYTTIMPYEGTANREFVGTITNYLDGFEEAANVDFKIVEYNSLSDLKQALSHGEVDLVFGNFDPSGVNVDVLKTNSLFKSEYYILSMDNLVVNSIRSLRGREIYTVNNTYLHDYLNENSIKAVVFDNTDMLLRSIHSNDLVMIDRDTYEYYKDSKFRNYKIVYQSALKNDYRFIIRDVDKNKTFYELYNYYIMSVNYKDIRYDYNTDYIVNSKSEISGMLKYLAIVLGITFALLILLIVILKFRNRKQRLKKEDKLKFIDVMTSLKNRNYLNYNIKTWEDNVIYPQAIVIIDLNNIKYINDNYGHVEGDEVIKKAASILINDQLENTDIVRTDGNEFLVYMVGYDEKKVIEYTRKISRDLKELPHEFGATLGYSMILDDIKTIDDAINEATLSMRQAKEKL